MITAFLAKIQRYGQVSEAEKAFLKRIVMHLHKYGPGQEIAAQGMSPPESCLVTSGFAGRIKTLSGGRRQILSLQVPGDFCDLQGFLLKEIDHSIEALSQCEIAKVPHSAIADITERFPRLTRALWWDTAVDAAVQREWMTSMGCRSAYEQIAHLLCEMLLRLQAVGWADSNSYDLPITQERLGDAFGLSTVHVNRTLQALRQNRLIVSEGARIIIPDVEALKKVAGFDPAYLTGQAPA
ncbi:MAG: Crp/Fnr family transcriptional regulator [Parvibaculaceae bacterium]